MRGMQLGVKLMRSGYSQPVAIQCLGVFGTPHKSPYLRDLGQVRGVEASDRAAPDDANAFNQLSDSRTRGSRSWTSIRSDSLPRSTRAFHANHGGKTTGAGSLKRAKDGIAGVVRIVDDHTARIQRVLQRGTDGMYRRGTTLAHTFGAVVREGRRRLHVSVEQVGHIDGGNRRVVTEGGGEQIAVAIVSAIFHQRGPDSVGGRAVDLALDDTRIDGAAAIIHASISENLRLKSFTIHFDHCDVHLSGIGQRQVAVLALNVRDLEGRVVHMTAVQRNVPKILGHAGIVNVHEIGEAPVVDGLFCALVAHFRPLRANSKLQVLFLGFQRPSRQPRHLVPQLGRRAVNRGEARDRKLARVGSGEAGIRVLLGVKARLYPDKIGGNAENVGDNLRRRRFVALSLRHGPHADDNFAVDIELGYSGFGLPGKWCEIVDDARLAKIVRAGIEGRADANANPAAFLARLGLFFPPIVPADQLFGEREHARVIAGVVDTAVGRGVWHFVFANVIAQAHFISGYAESVAADIEHSLHEPELLHARVAAIRSHGALVGHYLVHLDAHAFNAIRAGQHLRPDDAAQRLVPRIGAAIIDVT